MYKDFYYRVIYNSRRSRYNISFWIENWVNKYGIFIGYNIVCNYYIMRFKEYFIMWEMFRL